MVSEKLTYFIHNVTQFPSVTLLYRMLHDVLAKLQENVLQVIGTKNVGYYRLSWSVLSCSCLHTILIRGYGCKGCSKWRACQHASHSIPHCTTNTDVNKTSFACMNAEREQQHVEIDVLAAAHWSPCTNKQNFQNDCCSTHRYCPS